MSKVLVIKPELKNWELISDVLCDIQYHADGLHAALDTFRNMSIEVSVETSTKEESEAGRTLDQVIIDAIKTAENDKDSTATERLEAITAAVEVLNCL